MLVTQLTISTEHGGSVVISNIHIKNSDTGEVILDKNLDNAFVYPDDLLKLGSINDAPMILHVEAD